MADSWSTAKLCDLEVLLSAVDCFPTVPASPLPGARRSQDCSFEGLLNFNGEINEPQSHPFGPSQSVHQYEEEAFYTQHHFWCPGSILRTRKDCLSLSGPRYFGPSFASDGSQESDAEEGREMVSTPKVFRHKTRRKKRKRFNPYLPTAPCDESTWEPEDEVVSCPVITSDMSVSDALAAVACRATSCTKWEDAAVTCAEIAEATCAPGSTAYDLAEAWLLLRSGPTPPSFAWSPQTSRRGTRKPWSGTGRTPPPLVGAGNPPHT